MVSRNSDHIREYFPLTVKAADPLLVNGIASEWLRLQQKKEFFAFLLFEENSPQALGSIIVKSIDYRCSKAELAYFIDHEAQKQGVISNKLKEVIHFCFTELKLNKLYIRTAPENKASIRVAEKNGFRPEGLLRQEFRGGNGVMYDVAYYGLLKTDTSAG